MKVVMGNGRQGSVVRQRACERGWANSFVSELALHGCGVLGTEPRAIGRAASTLE